MSEKIECILLACQKDAFLLPLIALVEIVSYPHSGEQVPKTSMSEFIWRGIRLPLVNFMLTPLSAKTHPKVAIVRTLLKEPARLDHIAVLCEGKPTKIEIEEKEIIWEKEKEKKARLLKEQQIVYLLDLQVFAGQVQKRMPIIK